MLSKKLFLSLGMTCLLLTAANICSAQDTGRPIVAPVTFVNLTGHSIHVGTFHAVDKKPEATNVSLTGILSSACHTFNEADGVDIPALGSPAPNSASTCNTNKGTDEVTTVQADSSHSDPYFTLYITSIISAGKAYEGEYTVYAPLTVHTNQPTISFSGSTAKTTMNDPSKPFIVQIQAPTANTTNTAGDATRPTMVYISINPNYKQS